MSVDLRPWRDLPTEEQSAWREAMRPMLEALPRHIDPLVAWARLRSGLSDLGQGLRAIGGAYGDDWTLEPDETAFSASTIPTPATPLPP